MQYQINHTINSNTIHIQVIHNKTNTYYESFIENTDIHRQIFENINNRELNFHINAFLTLFNEHLERCIF